MPTFENLPFSAVGLVNVNGPKLCFAHHSNFISFQALKDNFPLEDVEALKRALVLCEKDETKSGT